MVTKKEIAKFLGELEYKDLVALKFEVEKVIDERQSEARNAAKEKLQEQARELGFEIDDLFSVRRTRGGKSTGERGPAAIKYRNPKNHSETWSGRGRTPKWIMREIAAGNAKKAEEFLIR